MTKHDCAVIMAYTGVTMLTGDDLKIFYEYITRLIGKPIYSHELPEYADEIKERAKPDFIEICKSAGDAPDWIPCSERLPEHNCYTLVAVFFDGIYEVYTAAFRGDGWHTVEGDVTHWMPLPEPPLTMETTSGIPSVSPLDFLAAEWERKHPQRIQFQE